MQARPEFPVSTHILDSPDRVHTLFQQDSRITDLLELFHTSIEDLMIRMSLRAYLKKLQLLDCKTTVCGYVQSPDEADAEPDVLQLLLELQRESDIRVVLPRYIHGKVTYHELDSIPNTNNIEFSHDLNVYQPNMNMLQVDIPCPTIILRPGSLAKGEFILSRNMGYDTLANMFHSKGFHPHFIGLSRSTGNFNTSDTTPVQTVITPNAILTT